MLRTVAREHLLALLGARQLAAQGVQGGGSLFSLTSGLRLVPDSSSQPAQYQRHQQHDAEREQIPDVRNRKRV